MPPTTPRRKRAAAEAARKRFLEAIGDNEDDNMPDASPSNSDNHPSSDDGSEYDGDGDSSSDEDVDMPDDGVENNLSDEDIGMSDVPDLHHGNPEVLRNYLIVDIEHGYQTSQPPLDLPALREDPDEDVEPPSQPSPLPVSFSALDIEPDGHLAHEPAASYGEEQPDDDHGSLDVPNKKQHLTPRQLAHIAKRHEIFHARAPARALLPRMPTKAGLARGEPVPPLPDGSKFCPRCRYARPLNEFEEQDRVGTALELPKCIECREDLRLDLEERRQTLDDEVEKAAQEDPSSKLCTGPCKRIKPLAAFQWMQHKVMTTHKRCSDCNGAHREYKAGRTTNKREAAAKHNESADATVSPQKYCPACQDVKDVSEFMRNASGEDRGKLYERESCNHCAQLQALNSKERKTEAVKKASRSNDTASTAQQFCDTCNRQKPISDFTRWGKCPKVHKAWLTCNECNDKYDGAAVKKRKEVRRMKSANDPSEG